MISVPASVHLFFVLRRIERLMRGRCEKVACNSRLGKSGQVEFH